MKKLLKKLELNKSTLSNLNSNSIIGGLYENKSIYKSCINYTKFIGCIPDNTGPVDPPNGSKGDLCASNDKTRCC